MSRKNKTLRAFLHQNKSPTIEQAWNHAWKAAQKQFHARSMQEMESKIDRLSKSLREVSGELADEVEAKYHGLRGYPIIERDYANDMMSVESARALLAELDK